jgi:hypothetical protein
MIIQATGRMQQHNDRRLGLALDLLASVYDRDGRFEQSERIHARMLNLLEANYGPEHPALVGSLENHALVLDALGRSEEAEALRIRGRAIRSRISVEQTATA